MLKSNLCDFNDAYVLVKGDISIVGNNGHQVAFKNCTPYTKCITKIDGTRIYDAEYLDLVISAIPRDFFGIPVRVPGARL